MDDFYFSDDVNMQNQINSCSSPVNDTLNKPHDNSDFDRSFQQPEDSPNIDLN